MKLAPTVVIVLVALGALAAIAAFAHGPAKHVPWEVTTSYGPCVKPAGGILIIEDEKGFNDSVDHNVLQGTPWPVLSAAAGSTVTITVCNVDQVAHGFNIQTYLETPVESMAPGQVLTVSGVVYQSGTFWIRCEIFCPVHVFMQNGELRVG